MVHGGVLLVDDDPIYLRAMERLLDDAGIGPVATHGTGGGALEKVEELRPRLVCLDLDLGEVDGKDLIADLCTRWPDIGVVVVSGLKDRGIAEECRRSGASGYLVKPFRQESFLGIVRRFHGGPVPVDGVSTTYPDAFAPIVTRSPAMLDVFRHAEAIAVSSLPILVTGETGTGKELMARALHDLRVPDGPFVAVNAAGLDDAMFTDTLFGHVAGAFTGADRARSGLVEAAGEGTLFLDEIGDLSPSSQVKLLRLLQENEYLPVGSDRPRRSRCRFVLATHRELGDDPSFRKDLYWRLASHRVRLPALRDRPEDVELLARLFVAEAAKDLRRPEPEMGEAFLRDLRNRPWPGNVRELRGWIHDQVARCPAGGRLVAKPLDVERFAARSGSDASFPTLAELQAFHISCALDRTGGNRTAAAELLGITRQTLIAHLKKDEAGRAV